MKLETELRLYLQLQRLIWKFDRPQTTDPINQCSSQLQVSPSTWVKLVRCPTPFSADEALLLCQCSENQWLAWVPDYGEITLFQYEIRSTL